MQPSSGSVPSYSVPVQYTQQNIDQQYYQHYLQQQLPAAYSQATYLHQPHLTTTQKTQYTQQRQQHSTPIRPPSGQPSNALWMGDIEPWMDENYVYSLFVHTGELTNVKLIKDKASGLPQGYGFVYFTSTVAAQKVLENFNGQPIPGTNKVFKYSLHPFEHIDQLKIKLGVRNEPNKVAPPAPTTQYSLFVGDLAPDVTEYHLLYYYPSVQAAKVVTDARTGNSKGYGFVYFGDEGEMHRALTEMQGFYLSTKPIRLNFATKKGEPKPPPINVQPTPQIQNRPFRPQPLPIPPQSQQRLKQQTPGSNTDPTNTTIFVGGLDPSITPPILRSFFSPFGEISQVKIPPGKGCGFIEFVARESAERVLQAFNGSATIGGNPVRLGWGRPAGKPQILSSNPIPDSTNGNPVSQGDSGLFQDESQYGTHLTNEFYASTNPVEYPHPYETNHEIKENEEEKDSEDETSGQEEQQISETRMEKRRLEEDNTEHDDPDNPLKKRKGDSPQRGDES